MCTLNKLAIQVSIYLHQHLSYTSSSSFILKMCTSLARVRRVCPILNPSYAQDAQTISICHASLYMLKYGMEAGIQLPLKKTPDSSISSLILVGWCEEGHPATKTRSNIPMDRQLPDGDWTGFSWNGSIAMTKREIIQCVAKDWLSTLCWLLGSSGPYPWLILERK